NARGELLLEERSQVRIGVLPEFLKGGQQLVVRSQNVRPRDARAVLVTASTLDPLKVAIATEIDQPAFPPVRVVPSNRALERKLVAQATCGARVAVQVILVPGRRGREFGKRVQRVDQVDDVSLAVIGGTLPRAIEIAPSEQLASGMAEALDRPLIDRSTS